MPEHATVTRPRTAPVHPRRLSGPVRRPLPAGPAVPRGRTGAFERLGRLPDHYLVDRLLRSRLCIWVIGLLLGGIVAMQVSLLKLNAGISRAVQTQSTLELQNASMQAAIAERTSGEQLRAAAAAASLIDPPAGERRYLRARPATDPDRAARRMKPPSQRSRDIMANGGRLPGALAATGEVLGTATVTTATTGVATAATTAAPVATPTPVPTAAPTVVPQATPVPGTGAAVAPDG